MSNPSPTTAHSLEFPAAKVHTFFLAITDSYRILPHLTAFYCILSYNKGSGNRQTPFLLVFTFYFLVFTFYLLV